MIFPIIFTFGFTPEGGQAWFQNVAVTFLQAPAALLVSTTFLSYLCLRP